MGTFSMKSMKSRTARLAAVAGLAAIGSGVLSAGTTSALWHDAEKLTGSVSTAQVGFGIGKPGAVNTFSDNGAPATFTIGKTEAQTLKDKKAIAIPIQVDGASNGSAGLDYVITNADWTKGVFGESDVKVSFVDKASDCVAPSSASGAARTAPPPAGQDIGASSTQTIVDTDDSAVSGGKRLSTQFLCVTAILKDTHLGTYSNTATAEGTDEFGTTVTAEDTWSTNVIKNLDPSSEPDHVLSFDPTVVPAT